ncbi:AmmeMemoRadiSam system radical SAM enzyme [Thalassospira sp. MA62]|nr:AmmeMemoRadiSam system radical SAM enzyme [Thalassospira sp. MA62]
MISQSTSDTVPARYWHHLDDGRIQCDVCPRFCKLKDGQRGLCFVRARLGDQMVLTTWGRSSGFCIDPVEKKPLNHFLPGTPILSFGTAAVTAGYIGDKARVEFFRHMDAANVDLKGFTDRFYHQLCSAHLDDVLETLKYLRHETGVWMELTNLVIPGENDGDAEFHEMTSWVHGELGPDVPMHFSAFHPDWKMMDTPRTPPETLVRARKIALQNGIRYAYVGNVHDKSASSTYCHHCGNILIGRDWYQLSDWNLDAVGNCTQCGTACVGVFQKQPGSWGLKRLPVRLHSG